MNVFVYDFFYIHKLDHQTFGEERVALMPETNTDTDTF